MKVAMELCRSSHPLLQVNEGLVIFRVLSKLSNIIDFLLSTM